MRKAILVIGSVFLLGIFIFNSSDSPDEENISSGKHAGRSYNSPLSNKNANDYKQLRDHYKQLNENNQLNEYYDRLNEYYQSNPNYYDQGNGYYNSNDNFWKSDITDYSGNYDENTGEFYILFDDGSSVSNF